MTVSRLPTLFVSHGAPTFALEPGLAGQRLRELGQRLPRPSVVVVVSPHWMTHMPRVSASSAPRTVHDFGGFPRALYGLQYAALGEPAVAVRTADLLRQAGWGAEVIDDQGLDHGAWVPLMHLYPKADVPVVQVSMPLSLDAQSAWDFGAALAPLADEGVLILGSGSLTHNLREFRLSNLVGSSYVREFSGWVRAVVEAGDLARFKQVLTEAPHAERAHPTPEHLWPLLIAAGASRNAGTATFIDGGVAHGVLAMDSVLFEAPLREQCSGAGH